MERREGRYILMTPRIREAISSTIARLEGFLDRMRMAELSTTVSIAFNPAAFIVSPDSNKTDTVLAKMKYRGRRENQACLPTRSTMPSATPRAHAASTLPLSSMIFVLNFVFFDLPVSLEMSVSASNAAK